MINFFGNQNSDESSDAGARLRAVEWKLNVLLALVGVQLLLQLLSFVSEMLSKSTMIIVVVGVLALGWFFRDRLLLMIRRIVAQRILGETQVESSSSSSGHRESSIR